MDVIAAPPNSRTDQVASPEALGVLEGLHEAGAVQAGAVNLIRLDAIRRHLDDRWPAKRARVWEHIERDLARRLTPQDVYFRLDEACYLVAMPATPKFMAQAACLAIVQDVLKYFLGEADMRHVTLRVVSAIHSGSITSEPLDPTAIIQAAARAATSSLDVEAPPAPVWKPPLAGRTHSLSFLTEARRKAEVRMGVEGVWNLRRGLVTSYAIERTVRPTLTNPKDNTRADCAVMKYVLELLDEHRTQGGRLALHVPISYAAVATLQSREKVLSTLAPARDLLRSTLLFEIAELDPGVPSSRLVEVVALLKPFCMGVLARVRPSKPAMAAVKSCGLQGVVLDAGELTTNELDLGMIMRAFVEAGQGVAPNILVHNLANAGLVPLATRCGMSHASTRPNLSTQTIIDAA